MTSVEAATLILSVLAAIPSTLLVHDQCQKSRIAHGGLPVPAQPTIGLLIATSFAAISRTVEPLLLLPLLAFALVLVSISVIDWCQFRIPNRAIKPAIAISAVGLAGAQRLGAQGSITRGVLGALCISAALGAIHLAQPRGMGRGDVRLGCLIGLHVGYLSSGYLDEAWRLGTVLAVASLLGLALALIQHWRNGGDGQGLRGAHVPFGPALSLATLIVVIGQI